MADFKKGGLDKATAQRVLKVWEETGATDPAGLKKLLVKRCTLFHKTSSSLSVASQPSFETSLGIQRTASNCRIIINVIAINGLQITGIGADDRHPNGIGCWRLLWRLQSERVLGPGRGHPISPIPFSWRHSPGEALLLTLHRAGPFFFGCPLARQSF